MKTKNILLSNILVAFLFILTANSSLAASKLVGLNTSGAVYEVDAKTGTLTKLTEDSSSNFSLGATARFKSTFYYVAAPSGASEYAIFSVNLKTNAVTYVDLDRSENVVALFLSGKNLYGVFYDSSNTGAVGVYKITPSTGATSLVVDLSSLSIEPVPGSLTKLTNSYYLIGKPSGDSTKRQLVKFRLKAGSAKATSIATKEGTDVLCDRILPNTNKQSLVCLASPSSTQVDVCQLSAGAKANCKSTLSGIERVAGGATFTTQDEKTYYAFVYATGESNNQRLLGLSSAGKIKTNATVSTLIIGAHFDNSPATPNKGKNNNKKHSKSKRK